MTGTTLAEQIQMRALLPSPLIFLIAMAVALIVVPTLCWSASAPLDFPPTKLTIYDSDGTEKIGHALYQLETVGGKQFVRGENRYLNGEYDIERDEIEVRPSSGGLQRLLTFRHEFFDADGTPQILDVADFRAGTGECTIFEGKIPVVNKKTFEYPRDTYAGAAVLIPLQNALRRGVTKEISFHDFNCVPGPEVFKVRAVPALPQSWDYYPGRTVKVRVTPNFGWITFMLLPFVPDIDAWFDPSEDWRFVGGKFARYYKGREILLVREPPGASATKSGSGS